MYIAEAAGGAENALFFCELCALRVDRRIGLL
jgi:hypothetical protein